MTEEEFWKGMTANEIKAFLRQAGSDMFGQMQSSKFAIIIAGPVDAKLALELGAAILFDKPIIVLAPQGQPPVNDKLRAVAEGIIQIDFGSEQSKQAAQLEITQILDRLVLQARKVEGKVN